QMTTSISCANRCTFCWRGYKAPVSKEWKWETDDPEMIHEGALKAHHKLLVGFKGSKTANQNVYEKSKKVKHVALSLTGEPIFYPKMNESIRLFNRDGISTFLVTNGQYPQQINDLEPITQLYISIDAPTQQLLKDVDVPLFTDYWERLNLSLDYLAKKKERTCVRLTIIKSINDVFVEKYADLIHRGDSDFIEVKAYMHVGQSQLRLKRENMPLHEEVVIFSKKLAEHLPGYEIVSEHISSRVVMFAKKQFKQDGVWKTWIDFPKWDQLMKSGEEFNSMSYCVRTPQTGLSGKGTIDNAPAHVQERLRKEHPLFVSEETEELSFYVEE
ncbi:4-demethylwyosine synthase TYW1, partial [archaeon]|nr:4-demethylwyosine synthase TYW1 [archaeon]